jgi:hypothetical protein
MFQISVKETFRGAPDASTEQLNFSSLMTFRLLDDVNAYIKQDIENLENTFNVLRKTTLVDDELIVLKVLYERPGRHGRRLRRYEIRKQQKQIFLVSLV